MTTIERKYIGRHVETDDGQRGVVAGAVEDSSHVTLFVAVGNYEIRTDTDHAHITHIHVGD